jgi:hypothetical protein
VSIKFPSDLKVPKIFVNIPGGRLPALTHQQVHDIATVHCRYRTMFDGLPRDPFEQEDLAHILLCWYYAFDEVLAPKRFMVEGDL